MTGQTVTLTINRGKRLLQVPAGDSLLKTLAANGILLPSACGGQGRCRFCRVKLLEQGSPFSQAEESTLTAEEKQNGVRLACQVLVEGPLQIEIPDVILLGKRFLGKLSSKRLLTADIVELRIDLLQPLTIGFLAGQIIQLQSESYNGAESVMRAYSISSSPADGRHIELMIRRVPEGICTTWIFDHLQEGQRVYFSGPYGDFHLTSSAAPALFIAGGSGMAPILSMLRSMKDLGIKRKCRFLFAAATQADLFHVEELRDLEKELVDFKFIPCLSREPSQSPWTGERGSVFDSLVRCVPDFSGYEAYLCGSFGLISAAMKVLQDAGVLAQNIFYDKFS